MNDNEVCSLKTKDLVQLGQFWPKQDLNIDIYTLQFKICYNIWKTFVFNEHKAQIWPNFAYLGKILGQIATKTVQLEILIKHLLITSKNFCCLWIKSLAQKLKNWPNWAHLGQILGQIWTLTMKIANLD